MRRRRGFGAFAALLVTGCAGRSVGIRADAPLDAGAAYLYGRFFIKAEQHYDSFEGRQSMGLVIECEDGRRYTFGSLARRDVQVLAIRPSRCWLIEAVFTDPDRGIRKRLPVDSSVQRALDFAGARAYYLGDYFAKSEFWANPRFKFTRNRWELAMSPAHDRYESTTAEMRRTFPSLASLPTVDARLVPEPERKLGNGIGAAPGEPPLSLERVARLAPLINRNYGSPSECEAACPAGQCRPYRGESGPAMACVIYCNRDHDCPDGLACNCPNSEKGEGPDCQPIATAPGDAMARICLSVENVGRRR